MTYEEQLRSPEWKRKRGEILKRDFYRCTKCLNKNLIEKYRTSLHKIGTYSNGRVLYIVYDKESRNTYRCKTNYDTLFLNELKKIIKKDSNSLIALTGGTGDFTYLISTLLTPDKLDLNNLNTEEKQKKQEEYLKWNSQETYENIKWIDTKGLHIHHRYYQIDKLAWEYPDEALITYCWKCHEQLHENTVIEIRDSKGTFIENKRVCIRCFGAGRFPEYSHVQNGVCFSCNGNKFEE